MKAISSSAAIGFASNHSVAFPTVHCFGRGAVSASSPAASLRLFTSSRKSLAVILRADGRRAALQGRTDGSNVGLPSLFLSPKLSTARAFNERPWEAYIISESV